MADYYEGPFGWARQTPPEAIAGHPFEKTTVASWFVHAPGQGLGYDDYLIAVVTLAPVEGFPPPKLRYPQAEYEILVVALNPERNPHPGDQSTWEHLEPVNFADQFHGITAEQAAQVAEGAAMACVNGRLPIETQAYVEPVGGQPKMMFIEQVVNLWKTMVMRTVQHLRTGVHATPDPRE